MESAVWSQVNILGVQNERGKIMELKCERVFGLSFGVEKLGSVEPLGIYL